jgi:hypothetical protein
VTPGRRCIPCSVARAVSWRVSPMWRWEPPASSNLHVQKHKKQGLEGEIGNMTIIA